MNQRRLVGMSMGARKRAARAHFMRWNYEMSVANRAYVLALFSPWDAAAVEYKRLRGLVRIGQRLRPCPGCRKCGYEPTVKMWKLSRDALWMSGRLGVRDIRNICDGSGALPAKGKVRR